MGVYDTQVLESISLFLLELGLSTLGEVIQVASNQTHNIPDSSIPAASLGISWNLLEENLILSSIDIKYTSNKSDLYP